MRFYISENVSKVDDETQVVYLIHRLSVLFLLLASRVGFRVLKAAIIAAVDMTFHPEKYVPKSDKYSES